VHRVTKAVRRQRRGAIRDSMSVQEYIDKHELTKVVEDAVNAAVKVKPDEPLSFLVRAIEPAIRSTIPQCRACIRPPVWSIAGEARLCARHTPGACERRHGLLRIGSQSIRLLP
jgi:hypothetical protein